MSRTPSGIQAAFQPTSIVSQDLPKGTVRITTFNLSLSFSPMLHPNRFSSAGVSPPNVSAPFAACDGVLHEQTSNALAIELSSIAGSPFTTGASSGRDPSPMSVAVDPSGNFAYVADFNGNGTTGYVSAYTINSSTGALTAITGSPFTAGNQPESVMVDPSGSSVCVANFFDNTVSGYSIDSSTGALTALSGSPYKTGNNTEPFSVTVDPTGQFLCEANALANTVACFSIDPHIRKSDSAGNQHGLLLERRPRLSRWTHQANSSMSPIRAEAYPHSAPAVP